MQYDPGMADDLTGVPTGELRRLRETVQRATALTLALWALVLVLVLTLARKRVIGWPDLLGTVGWHG